MEFWKENHNDEEWIWGHGKKVNGVYSIPIFEPISGLWPRLRGVPSPCHDSWRVDKHVGPLPSDINNAYHVACEPFNFYAVGCSKTYAGDCFPQRWKLVHESHWSLMGFWTAKWKFSREHVAELTSDIWKFTIFTKDSDTCDIFVFRTCECAFYFYLIILHLLVYLFINTLQSHGQIFEKTVGQSWQRHESESHFFILRIRICQETQETETEALPPERSSLRQRKVSDKPVTTSVSWQSEVPVLRVVMTQGLVGLSILKTISRLTSWDFMNHMNAYRCYPASFAKGDIAYWVARP